MNLIDKRPKLKKGLCLVPIEDGTALLCSSERMLQFRGEAATLIIPRLCPLLNGNHTLGEIYDTLSDVDTQEIKTILNILEEKNLFEIRDHSLKNSAHQEISDFYASINGSFWDSNSITSSKVLVVGDWDRKTSLCHYYRQALFDMGISQVRAVSVNPEFSWNDLVRENNLVMFIPSLPALSARKEIHEACLNAKVKLCSAEFLNASKLILGPTVVPGETACWDCYEHRIMGVQNYFRENTAFQNFLKLNPDFDPVSSRLPALSQLLAGLAAFETVRILTEVLPPLTYGNLITLDCNTLSLEQHNVLKLPRCPTCSPVKKNPSRRIWSW